mmetsp:Transcript_14650/g.29612  ORF Transcript_14650/g.29612 Transcript_14650/m.29612 type:complete len:463 (-) Transcript_14650:1683-3071(-)|eukprot:CAMPEP_0178576780 /NCGR_PEP_ID=MMETSP0697-20121206/20645_1 /TAXON_ID=265572 /ORGANISM="Extubocellulus spinifer, Strain CCMP396" /LENGTH=462 /DNA_ID=CAMNT_0020212011 /DNA_START=96 /DNA_END=1484 /DNA_ORIENTATION=+
MKFTPTVFFAIAAIPSSSVVVVDGFAPSLFQPAQRTVPAKTGHDIELPDFDEMFSRIKNVSPLARQLLDDLPRGFVNVSKEQSDWGMKWRTIESNKKRAVHHIDKVDNYLGLGPPLLRFRATLEGPCLGEPFANFIMSLEEREQWDDQIAEVNELYPVDASSVTDILAEDKFGESSQLGVGYCQTKSAFGIAPREQLTCCGVQQFDDGSAIIWGTEMEEELHDHLLPELPGTKRPTRAKSHIFSTTLTPSGENKFDVEYCLQMCTGGLPAFVTTPVMVNTVKNLFNYAKKFYAGGEGSELEAYLATKEAERVHEQQEKAEQEQERLLHLATEADAQAEKDIAAATAAVVATEIQPTEVEAPAIEIAETAPVATVVMVEQTESERPSAHVTVPEHDGPHIMEESEHDRLISTHTMVHINDMPQSTIRRMASKTVSKLAGAKSLVRSLRDRMAAELASRDIEMF